MSKNREEDLLWIGLLFLLGKLKLPIIPLPGGGKKKQPDDPAPRDPDLIESPDPIEINEPVVDIDPDPIETLQPDPVVDPDPFETPLPIPETPVPVPTPAPDPVVEVKPHMPPPPSMFDDPKPIKFDKPDYTAPPAPDLISDPLPYYTLIGRGISATPEIIEASAAAGAETMAFTSKIAAVGGAAALTAGTAAAVPAGLGLILPGVAKGLAAAAAGSTGLGV